MGCPARKNSGNEVNKSKSPELRVLRPDEIEASSAEQMSPTEEMLTELRQASQTLEKATPQEILKWAVERYAPRFAMATAFGPEGMTIIHMLAEIAPQTPIFNLDTGYQFEETLELREEVKRRYASKWNLSVRPQLLKSMRLPTAGQYIRRIQPVAAAIAS